MSVLLEGIVQERFASRKNNVFRMSHDGRTYVVKCFSGERAALAQTEYSMLVECGLRKVPAPTPIELSDSKVLMSYVEGRNAGDVFDSIWAGQLTPEQASEAEAELVEGVASWLASFHRAFRWEMRRGDSILRNFILAGDRVCGIDFEEARPGDPFMDLGEACAWSLSTDPMFTNEKFMFVRRLIASYLRHSGRDMPGRLPVLVADALDYYAGFRPNGRPMVDWARRIRDKGI